MADKTITKGYDIPLAGKPAASIEDAATATSVSVSPREFPGIRLRLIAKDGDAVKRGSVLFVDKRDERVQFVAPAGGKVRQVVRGERRVVEQIIIDIAREEEVEKFPSFAPADIARLSREDVVTHLGRTGCFTLIQQRPFSRMAMPAALPKSIFVNAMNTAPFQADSNVALRGEEAAFQAGLEVLTRVTAGAVHLCMDRGARDIAPALANARNVQKHTFAGPHPAGNSSVHIAAIDPLGTHDTIWVVRAPDVAYIGSVFLRGELPAARVIALGGHGVKEEYRKHYRIRPGADLSAFLAPKLAAGEQRVILGDVLTGRSVQPTAYASLGLSSITVIPEGRERRLLGWLAAGTDRLSFSRAYFSALLGRKTWALNTSRNGGHRAMVLTGYYDRVMPLDIMVDYLIRAVLANDTDEAVKLGILETDPEDFALCEFICPCKTEIQQIIRNGLDMIEREGL